MYNLLFKINLRLVIMGSPYTTIVVGVLLSIFVSMIIAETPLDEVSNIDAYHRDRRISKR